MSSGSRARFSRLRAYRCPPKSRFEPPPSRPKAPARRSCDGCKSVGDEVAENEPLIEIETDKVTVEVASPGSGTLREIFKQEQDEIVPGDLLGRIDGGGPGAKRVAGVSAAAGVGATAGVGGRIPAVTAASAATTVGRPVVPASGAAPGSAENPSAVRALSPAVRRLLGERGLDASEVRGTGQGGRITVEDVLGHKGANGTARPLVLRCRRAPWLPSESKGQARRLRAAPVCMPRAARALLAPARAWTRLTPVPPARPRSQRLAIASLTPPSANALLSTWCRACSTRLRM